MLSWAYSCEGGGLGPDGGLREEGGSVDRYSVFGDFESNDNMSRGS